MHDVTEYSSAKTGVSKDNSTIFRNMHVVKTNWRIVNTIASIWCENMLGDLLLDIICSSELTVFLELCSQKTVCFSEHIMSGDKYLSIVLCQMEAIAYFTIFLFATMYLISIVSGQLQTDKIINK